MSGKKFETGQMYVTRCIAEESRTDSEFAQFVQNSLGRHFLGDWGDLDEEDKQENEFALGRYLRIFSAYKYKDGRKIWIITEADRSVTTVLFPTDY